MEALLEAVFYRQSCPTAEQLLDYHLGLLASTVDRQLRQHIELCPHCTADLRDLMQIGVDAQPATVNASQQMGLLHRIQQLIPNLSLVPGIPQQSLALPELRGANDGDQRVYAAGDYRIALSILRLPSSMMVTLEGSLLNASNPTQSLAGKVHLLSTDSAEPMAEAALDDFGVFTFSALHHKTYALAFDLSTQAILVSGIEI